MLSDVMLLIVLLSYFCDTALVDVSADVERPSFMRQLQNTEVSEGSRLYLSCSFTGWPKPQIQWLRNDSLVLPSAVYRVCINLIWFQDCFQCFDTFVVWRLEGHCSQ